MKIYPFKCAKCGGRRFFLLLSTMYCWACERPQETASSEAASDAR